MAASLFSLMEFLKMTTLHCFSQSGNMFGDHKRHLGIFLRLSRSIPKSSCLFFIILVQTFGTCVNF